jgi:hypothetical protein
MGTRAYLQFLTLQMTATQNRINAARKLRDRAYWQRVYDSQSKLAADLESYLFALELING